MRIGVHSLFTWGPLGGDGEQKAERGALGELLEDITLIWEVGFCFVLSK